MPTATQTKVVTARCQFCKRTLTDAASIARNAGPECSAKLAQQTAAIDTGKAIEKALGDYSLLTKGAHLRTMERLECRYTSENVAVPLALQRDLQAARVAYARRVEYLASQGILTICEPETVLAPTDEALVEMAAGNVEPTIERRQLCKGGTVERMPLSDAVIRIQGESFSAAASRRAMKAILANLRTGHTYRNWHAEYRQINLDLVRCL